MAHQHLRTVLLLVGRGTVKVLPECSLDSGTVPKELLNKEREREGEDSQVWVADCSLFTRELISNNAIVMEFANKWVSGHGYLHCTT